MGPQTAQAGLRQALGTRPDGEPCGSLGDPHCPAWPHPRALLDDDLVRQPHQSGKPAAACRAEPDPMPCLAASLATTNRPIRRDTATSTIGGLSSRQFACAISSAPMPTPWSVISSNTPPLFSKCPDTPTGVSSAEHDVAFSASSASSSTTSLTACPRTTSLCS